jgi:hypothetical protein
MAGPRRFTAHRQQFCLSDADMANLATITEEGQCTTTTEAVRQALRWYAAFLKQSAAKEGEGCPHQRSRE